jgi:hypothetical protein
MYENENTHYSSTCLRYANSQTEPHILHKNGRRFNSTTLTKWISFDTRFHRDEGDRVNRPNFGFQQRPGFFPSEVTYEFLYPKRLQASESHTNGKISLSYYKDQHKDEFYGRHHKDTTKHRRKVRRNECIQFQMYEQDYDCEEDFDDDEFPIISSKVIDEDEKWSIVFEDSGKVLYFI